MKSGDAVFLHLAATVAEPAHDITLIIYDCEEIEAAANGLGRIERELPDWLPADVAILGEPSGGYIEAGCQGTLRVVISATGTRAHSARSWLGDNAIHKLGAVLDRLAGYDARIVDIDGCAYREGLSAVRIDGGVAGNVIPDAAVAHRQLPLRARPVTGGRAGPRARGVRRARRAHRADRRRRRRAARAARTRRPRRWWRPPTGWCARSTAGPTSPGSPRWASPRSTSARAIPNLAHRRDERVAVAQITAVADMLRRYLSGLTAASQLRAPPSAATGERRSRTVAASFASAAAACVSPSRRASLPGPATATAPAARLVRSRTATAPRPAPPRSRAVGRRPRVAPAATPAPPRSSGANNADLVPCRDSARLSVFAASAISPCWASAVASSISDSGPHE